MGATRQQQRLATAEEIKRVARRQMAAAGAAALSLRGIAAEMGITAPALYRYFPNRDALVTALIVDAFDALGAATREAAAAGHGSRRGAHAGRFARLPDVGAGAPGRVLPSSSARPSPATTRRGR